MTPTGARTGAIIFSVMGTLWWVVGSGAADRGGVTLVVVGVLVGVVVTWWSGSRARTTRSPATQTMRAFNRVNLAQGAAILVCACAAGRLGHVELIPPIVAAIVGLHFFPMARIMTWPGHRRVGVALLAAAAIGAVMVLAGAEAAPVLLITGLACAVVLWAGAIALAKASMAPGLR